MSDWCCDHMKRELRSNILSRVKRQRNTVIMDAVFSKRRTSSRAIFSVATKWDFIINGPADHIWSPTLSEPHIFRDADGQQVISKGELGKTRQTHPLDVDIVYRSVTLTDRLWCFDHLGQRGNLQIGGITRKAWWMLPLSWVHKGWDTSVCLSHDD